MTRQQMYRELERLYNQVDWSNKESIRKGEEKAREICGRFLQKASRKGKQVAEEENEK